MGRRSKNARDRHGVWEFGGGELEPGETIEAALRRECREEFGVEISSVQQIALKEYVKDGDHWLGIFCSARIDRSTARIAEPVFSRIEWFTPDDLPESVRDSARPLALKSLACA